MENPSIHHDLGRHDAQIESLQQQVRQLHTDMQTMNATLGEINRTLSEARGGWKTLMLVGGIAAAVGATVAKIATWLGWVPK
jgi:prefoldin subunit 5